jgi:hypothetical protein
MAQERHDGCREPAAEHAREGPWCVSTVRRAHATDCRKYSHELT